MSVYLYNFNIIVTIVITDYYGSAKTAHTLQPTKIPNTLLLHFWKKSTAKSK